MNQLSASASALLQHRLKALTPDQLQGMRRGIEKESLRAQPGGALALTPHPVALGSALMHPNITTDFSESQVELVTGAHKNPEAALHELTELHQCTYRALQDAGDEMLWVSSMPCGLPTDETIPLARPTSGAPRAFIGWGWATVTGGACRRFRAFTTTGPCRA